MWVLKSNTLHWENKEEKDLEEMESDKNRLVQNIALRIKLTLTSVLNNLNFK
jgi:hypothetical protein